MVSEDKSPLDRSQETFVRTSCIEDRRKDLRRKLTPIYVQVRYNIYIV